MKNKIIILVCAFALCFTLLAIPSFALENDFTGDYEFSYSLDFNPIDFGGSLFDYRVAFTCQDVDYEMISFITNINTHAISMHYWTDDSSVMVYSSDVGWYDDAYRYIYVHYYDDQNPYTINFLSFLLENEYTPEPLENGWYYEIYDIIQYYVFADNPLNSSEEMVVTLISLVFTILAISLPVIVVFFFVKYILSMRFC